MIGIVADSCGTATTWWLLLVLMRILTLSCSSSNSLRS